MKPSSRCSPPLSPPRPPHPYQDHRRSIPVFATTAPTELSTHLTSTLEQPTITIPNLPSQSREDAGGVLSVTYATICVRLVNAFTQARGVLARGHHLLGLDLQVYLSHRKSRRFNVVVMARKWRSLLLISMGMTNEKRHR